MSSTHLSSAPASLEAVSFLDLLLERRASLFFLDLLRSASFSLACLRVHRHARVRPHACVHPRLYTPGKPFARYLAFVRVKGKPCPSPSEVSGETPVRCFVQDG